jgi:hypothetical protein
MSRYRFANRNVASMTRSLFRCAPGAQRDLHAIEQKGSATAVGGNFHIVGQNPAGISSVGAVQERPATLKRTARRVLHRAGVVKLVDVRWSRLLGQFGG